LITRTTNDITQNTTQIWFFIFVGIILVVNLIMFVFTKQFPIIYTFITGIFFALGTYSVQFVMSMLSFSGYNLLSIAGIGKILKNLFTDPNLLKVIVGAIFIVIFNMIAGFVMQIGLQKVAASKFNPIQQTINNIVSVIGGIIIFGQIIGNWWFYLFGMIFGIIGTLILGQYQVPTKIVSESHENHESHESLEVELNKTEQKRIE
jgi:hypothetical protein